MHRRLIVLGPIVCAGAALTGCATGNDPAESAPLPARPPSADDVALLRAKAGGSPASEVVMTALNYLDTPYRAGGTRLEDGFDCSGFTRQVYADALGLSLPRQADDQAQTAGLKAVRREQLQAGDLVFFNTLRRTFSHVGIYIGDGRFIHAPRTGAQVRVEQMSTSYWARRYTGARRPALLAQSP